MQAENERPEDRHTFDVERWGVPREGRVDCSILDQTSVHSTVVLLGESLNGQVSLGDLVAVEL